MARIAVIGAGLGAMAAAARLAVAGHRVTVFERTSTYGGAVGRFERDGFAFDTGPGLLHLPAVYRDLFVKTGKEPLESRVELTQVDPASRHVFADGVSVDLPNASRAGTVAALDTALGGGAGERWGEFLVRAREAWDRTRRPLLEEPQPADVARLGREPYPAPKAGFLRRPTTTLAQVGARELRDPRLVALLDAYAWSYGFDPSTAPAAAAVLPYMEQTFGSWYVSGGVRALADAVYERCVARRVEFALGAEVTGVRTKDGRAAGIELADGTVVDADHVVAGARVPALDDLGGRPRHGSPGTGRVVLCLALRGGREPDAVHRTVVHAAAGRPTVTVLRPGDPALVPDDAHEAATVTATVSTAPGQDWAEYAERMLGAAESAIPGLRERLLHHEVRTPDDTLRETGSAEVPGPALGGADGRHLPAGNVSPLPGLYFAGGWAHPGGGLAHAGMSGALVSGLIVEGADFRGSQ
ncbi:MULTISPECIES: phytoene desaturase family protein [Streptomyces]|uniref:NAD(P)/FAD-dependent oxidoreductase n=1 Tax=Streptomyces solicathayae TaxID=3081768 RepID=A0ABZ0LZD7_9ACTN|nr:NAD(P)/FAD-dependent oxidoreductase [Streptomyces sp. HUAS YS2]WOX24863.1 NAD(P)/FAD-dependent oxidoreductase [Streptomyces sp. HUAS YS2]